MAAALTKPVSVNAPFTMMRYDREIAVGPGYSRCEAYEQSVPCRASNRDCPNA
jgi:hypothetical protein